MVLMWRVTVCLGGSELDCGRVSERGEISEESGKVICRDTGKNRGARCGCLGIHALDCELGKGINQAAVSHVDVEIEMREKISTENGLLKCRSPCRHQGNDQASR